MADITDLFSHRARRLAQTFWTAYRKQARAMRLLGASRLGMILADDGEILVVDLAACLVVVTALSRLDLSAAALKAMRVEDARAYELLQDAAEAYGRSSALKDELGGPGSAAFPHLRAVLANAA